jgi:pimeloyl-ACP methyl ester carboxylesterase
VTTPKAQPRAPNADATGAEALTEALGGRASALATPGPIEWVSIAWADRTVSIEHQWISRHSAGPLIVFLHEGLGSVSMWRDFPAQVCTATGARGLVYSRPGYGQSTPRAAGEAWDMDFMHRQAQELLPALLQALGIDAQRDQPWLLGHSDGGSIALIYASHAPEAVAGLVVLAPHIKVEPISVASIAKAKAAYLETDLRSRLARHHADPDSAFWGWANVWLDPRFVSWTIEGELDRITCPVLAIQGLDDEYGTLAQIHGIAEKVAKTQLLALPVCGHSPHRDQGALVLAAVTQQIGETADPGSPRRKTLS